LLIRALAIVNAQPSQSKLTIDFVGDGPSLEYLVAIAADAGVTEFCNFIGAKARRDIYQTLCHYDLLVQPSRFEGFGLTVAEGMAAKIAVIVSDIEGPMEVIGSGKFGHHFKSNDAMALADTLRNVMSSIGTPGANELLELARNQVVERYDLTLTAKRYCQIYGEVVNG